MNLQAEIIDVDESEPSTERAEIPQPAADELARADHQIATAPASRAATFLRCCIQVRRFVERGSPAFVQVMDDLQDMGERHGIEPAAVQTIMQTADFEQSAAETAAVAEILEGWERDDPRDYHPARDRDSNGYAGDGDWDPRSPWAPETAPAVLNEWDAGEAVGKPPPRGWLLGNQFCRQFLAGLAAPGATGKTAVRTAQYLALATGRAITGQHVFKRCRVLQLSLEDDENEMRRRLAAACIHHRIDQDELRGWLFCATPKGLKLAVLKDGALCRGPLEAILRQTIAQRKIDLLALDPLVKLHAVNENDNGAMDFVCDLLAQLAAEFDIAVDLPMHTKKGPQTAGDADAGRGASSTRDAGRLMNTLTRMTEEEAKLFGIPIEQRGLYVRLDNAKVNIAPPSGEATWFRLIGVRLDNGTEDYPSGDEVQTVERWHPPKTWEGLTSAQLNAVLDDIATGLPNGQRYSDAPKAGARAAWMAVQKHCPSLTEPQCREVVRTWVKNGVLIPEDYHDEIERKERKGLRIDPRKRPV